ncbi:EAL domain-containing protein [Jeotgalibacillus sp. S-D1]|uniref:EAL domain-containing protein n=1 Tax=Jeotgalibacillus sp. S-D1 TaxID=2552189 RepID=UPI00105A42A8|nr:EAL domain-containing protein [Jeotgalibacillus sp. S-D1]TDL31134.1 EAL domain-containing protein [Jeotgalibacillus sp. S-D1]
MLNNLIRNELFSHSFQPIIDIQRWRKIGFEGLLKTSHFNNVEDVFKLAIQEKQLYELDSKSIHKAALTYHSAGFSRKDCYLFLNVFPSTLINANFLPFVRKIITEYAYFNHQIIFEISETEVIRDFSSFKKQIIQLRSEGFLFAIDDVGKGNSNFKYILELEPTFIKLDQYFSNSLYKNLKKQDFIKSIINYTDNHEIKLILKGIETEIDLAMAKCIGVKYGQGNILGRPESLIVV